MQDCTTMEKPNRQDPNFAERMEDWMECQRELRELDREARAFEREEKREAMADFELELKEIDRQDRRYRRMESRVDRKQNRTGIFVLVGLVLLVFWFLYQFILEKNDTTFYTIVAGFTITVFVMYMRLFREQGATGGAFKIV